MFFALIFVYLPLMRPKHAAVIALNKWIHNFNPSLPYLKSHLCFDNRAETCRNQFTPTNNSPPLTNTDVFDFGCVEACLLVIPTSRALAVTSFYTSHLRILPFQLHVAAAKSSKSPSRQYLLISSLCFYFFFFFADRSPCPPRFSLLPRVLLSCN